MKETFPKPENIHTNKLAELVKKSCSSKYKYFKVLHKFFWANLKTLFNPSWLDIVRNYISEEVVKKS